MTTSTSEFLLPGDHEGAPDPDGAKPKLSSPVHAQKNVFEIMNRERERGFQINGDLTSTTEDKRSLLKEKPHSKESDADKSSRNDKTIPPVGDTAGEAEPDKESKADSPSWNTVEDMEVTSNEEATQDNSEGDNEMATASQAEESTSVKTECVVETAEKKDLQKECFSDSKSKARKPTKQRQRRSLPKELDNTKSEVSPVPKRQRKGSLKSPKSLGQKLMISPKKGPRAKMSLTPKKGLYPTITHFFSRNSPKNSPLKATTVRKSVQKQMKIKRARRKVRSEASKENVLGKNVDQASETQSEESGSKSRRSLNLDHSVEKTTNSTPVTGEISSSAEIAVSNEDISDSMNNSNKSDQLSTMVKSDTTREISPPLSEAFTASSVPSIVSGENADSQQTAAQITEILCKKPPKAKKSFKSSKPSALLDNAKSQETSHIDKQSEEKKGALTLNLAPFSNMTFKLTEVETVLGIKEKSLSKMDSKTLDKIILEKAQKKKAVLKPSQVQGDGSHGSNLMATGDAQTTIQRGAVTKRRRRRGGATYHLPGSWRKKPASQASSKKKKETVALKEPKAPETASEWSDVDDEDDLKLSEIKKREICNVESPASKSLSLTVASETCASEVAIETSTASQETSDLHSKVPQRLADSRDQEDQEAAESDSEKTWVVKKKKQKHYQYKAKSSWAKGRVPKVKITKKVIKKPKSKGQGKNSKKEQAVIGKVYYVMKSPIKTLAGDESLIDNQEVTPRKETEETPVLCSILNKPIAHTSEEYKASAVSLSHVLGQGLSGSSSTLQQGVKRKLSPESSEAGESSQDHSVSSKHSGSRKRRRIFSGPVKKKKRPSTDLPQPVPPVAFPPPPPATDVATPQGSPARSWHSPATSPWGRGTSPRGKGTRGSYSPRGRGGTRGRGGVTLSPRAEMSPKRGASPRGARRGGERGHMNPLGGIPRLQQQMHGLSHHKAHGALSNKWPSFLSDAASASAPFVNTPNGVTYPVTPPYTPEEGSTASASSDDTTAEIQAMRGGSQEPDLPPVCSCTVEGFTFANLPSVSYCQALDSIDNKTVGCSNKVSGSQLHRPSLRVPFLALCQVHRQRLKAHQCCPQCGHFCSQGKFYQCKTPSAKGPVHLHHYHLECGSVHAGQTHCPHCAKPATHTQVHLKLNEPRTPANFFKTSFKPPGKPRPCAKMRPVYPSGVAQSAELVPTHTASTASQEEGESKLSQDADIKIPISGSDKLLSLDGMPVGPEHTALKDAMTMLQAEKPKKLRAGGKCLYSASRVGELDRVLFMLVEGVDPGQTSENFDSQTGLHGAAESGYNHIVHLLLQAGAPPNCQDTELRTPLMNAAENGHQQVLVTLLKAGALPELKANDGMTALHLAAKSGRVDAVKTLLQMKHVDINVKDDGGWTPVIWAAEHRHMSTVQFLLEMGADPCLKDNEENTGLHWASFSGSADIAEMFLNCGCDLESPNEHGDRPLHIAARQDHYECVVLFLLHGADVGARNNENDTPVSVILDKTSASYMALYVYKELRKAAQSRLPRPQKLLHRDISYGREANPVPVVNDCDEENYPRDFLYVAENVETVPMNINRTITSLQSCTCQGDCGSIHCVCGHSSIRCWYDKEGRLSEDFNFADPPLVFECNKACHCWTTCQNRVVQLGITLQVFRTLGRGWGCRTLQNIRRGTFVCEYIGELISDAEADSREDDSYLFDLDNKDVDTFCVDARKYGNVARFINHLCHPNLMPVKVFIEHQDLRFPRICFFASRDIEAGEELGFDYGDKFWIIKWKQFTCACGSPFCRYSKETIHKTIEEFNRRTAEEEACSNDL